MHTRAASKSRAKSRGRSGGGCRKKRRRGGRRRKRGRAAHVVRVERERVGVCRCWRRRGRRRPQGRGAALRDPAAVARESGARAPRELPRALRRLHPTCLLGRLVRASLFGPPERRRRARAPYTAPTEHGAGHAHEQLEPEQPLTVCELISAH